MSGWVRDINGKWCRQTPSACNSHITPLAIENPHPKEAGSLQCPVKPPKPQPKKPPPKPVRKPPGVHATSISQPAEVDGALRVSSKRTFGSARHVAGQSKQSSVVVVGGFSIGFCKSDRCSTLVSMSYSLSCLLPAASQRIEQNHELKPFEPPPPRDSHVMIRLCTSIYDRDSGMKRAAQLSKQGVL